MKTTEIIKMMKEHQNKWIGHGETIKRRVVFYHSHIKMYFFIKKLRKDKRYAALKELPFFLVAWNTYKIRYKMVYNNGNILWHFRVTWCIVGSKSEFTTSSIFDGCVSN